MTVKEQIDNLINEVRSLQSQQTHSQGGASREFALAITHLEDAQIRATRGLAKLQGDFNPADLQKDNA